jgi:hypothetical protein
MRKEVTASSIEGQKMFTKTSLATFIYINLAIGLLTAAANGAALLLTLGGRGGNLTGQIPEMTAWFATGAILLAMSGFALIRRESTPQILRLQAGVVIALIIGLALWGVSAILIGPVTQSRVTWSVGYLSLGALYSVILALRAFDELKHFGWRILAWGFFAVCVLIDISVIVKLSDF